MDSIVRLSAPVMGFWLAIVGIAIAFGVLYAIAGFLRNVKRHSHRAGQDGRDG